MAKSVDIHLLLSHIADRACKASFRKLFDLYYPKLYRMALYWLHSEELAEEVISDVFVKLWKKRKDLKNIASLDNYLFIAVKRQSLNYLEKDKKHRFQEDMHALLEQEAGKDSQPEQVYLQQELHNLVQEAIENLPIRCRLVFQMVRIDGLKYQQVAEQLDISPKTVENQVLKASLLIRECISNYQQHQDMQTYLQHVTKYISVLLPLTFSILLS